ncbi:uncharacterized protein [Marmota flaviventris]|uniref:uncharacterized protein isoform X1 n=1 Tax=Marmota flaviventris TaxID=93162 RepID=UPI003A847FA0
MAYLFINVNPCTFQSSLSLLRSRSAMRILYLLGVLLLLFLMPVPGHSGIISAVQRYHEVSFVLPRASCHDIPPQDSPPNDGAINHRPKPLKLNREPGPL